MAIYIYIYILWQWCALYVSNSAAHILEAPNRILHFRFLKSNYAFDFFAFVQCVCLWYGSVCDFIFSRITSSTGDK